MSSTVSLTPRAPSKGSSARGQGQGSTNSVRGAGYVGVMLSRDESTSHLPDEGVHPSGAMSARQTSTTINRREGTKEEFAKKQKMKEHALKHDKMLAARERDEAEIKARAAHVQLKRDQRFQEMMDEVRDNDTVRVEAAHIIQQFELEQDKKRQDLWHRYDQEVSQRVELQLQHFMTRKDPADRLGREELRPSDDPAKQSIVDQRAEDNFRRIAESIIHCGKLKGGQAALKEQIHLRQTIEQAVTNRASTRPVLPVEMWGQQELFSGPYGYFAQRCERMDRGEAFHSTRRMGANSHRPNESDGVPAAGKKREKTRLVTNYNHMGALQGDHAKVGEAYRHKKSHGAGSAAPLQDHYFYQKGNDVVESEFPVGKRCFVHLAREK